MTTDISWRTLWRVLFFLALAGLIFFALRVLLALFLAIVVVFRLGACVKFYGKTGFASDIGSRLDFYSRGDFGYSHILRGSAAACG